jgi:uncharacterized protein YhfF
MRAHAALLDVTHRLLSIEGAPFAVDVPPGTRPLHALETAAPKQLGRELHVPLGRHIAGDDAWFVFVDTTLTAGELIPLRTWAAQLATPWTLYIDGMLGGWSPPTTDLDVFFFGNEPRLASQLAHHVIKGTKHGTTCWVAAAEHEGLSLPHPGGVSIVTDGFGIPLCAIETTRVDRARFRDVGSEIAAAEGEGDLSFADWHAAHRRYFEAEGERLGLAFTDDAELCCEYFRVLRVFRRSA